MSETQFHSFFDDAATFPPGLVPLDVAVREHIRRAADEVTDVFIGPLILPLDKVRDAATLAVGQPLDLSVVVPEGGLVDVEELLSEISVTATTVSGLEVKVGSDAAEGIAEAAKFAAEHPDLIIFIELPYDAVADENLSALEAGGLALKFRTGGIRQELFPTSEQVVDVLSKAVDRGLPFKLTAGLHRAMRYTDGKTGFRHFGFANIAAATAALRDGATPEQACAVLDTDDTGRIAATLEGAPRWRDNFTSFGTCSVAEPAETLAAIGLLTADTAARF